MVLVEHKVHLKVSQRQILTPGLVKMVSVLALNKLELRDMITAEMVENPVLEELEDSVPLLDDVNRREEERECPVATEEAPVPAEEKKDPFEEIDFGSFFQEYLDPGYRSPGEMEEVERTSFENFLSKPSTLTDHLMWQLGAIPMRSEVHDAAELVIGNLNEDGYLIASDDELMGVEPPAPPEVDATIAENLVKEAAALGLAPDVEDAEAELEEIEPEDIHALGLSPDWAPRDTASLHLNLGSAAAVAPAPDPVVPPPPPVAEKPVRAPQPQFKPTFVLADLHEAIEIVRQLDPPGVACRDLRECLLYQLRHHQQKSVV